MNKHYLIIAAVTYPAKLKTRKGILMQIKESRPEIKELNERNTGCEWFAAAGRNYPKIIT